MQTRRTIIDATYHARISPLPVEVFPFAHSLWHISKQLQAGKRYTYHQLQQDLLALE
jgi:hypothetical protein